MIDYKTSAKPRIVTKDDVAVFCSYDEIVPIGQLQPNPRNPNQHTEQQVKLLGEIIRSAGWRAPITVSKRSGLIVKGHGRRLAAIDARLAWVPVEYQEYATEAEEYADLLADNRIAELAEMDNDKLSEILKDLQETENFNMDLTGFDEDALADLIGEQLTSDDIEEDEVPETQETVFTKPGDLFIMGNHLGLFAYQIENSSKAGDVVLDSFAGSGTTMVACEKMGRKAMLMELDPKYCDVIIRRYIQESGNLDLKVERDGEIKSLKDVMEEVGATLE